MAEHAYDKVSSRACKDLIKNFFSGITTPCAWSWLHQQSEFVSESDVQGDFKVATMVLPIPAKFNISGSTLVSVERFHQA